MNFYAETFDDFSIVDTQFYGSGDPHGGEEGKVLFATARLNGGLVHFMDMPERAAAPALNWATSLILFCDSREQFERYFAALAADGTVMMGPETDAKFERVTWVSDRFGLTWQVLLEK
jgi:predicted 3-demethylubiquinone-9 3-methyltransferase (glyoxalase superfamily)